MKNFNKPLSKKINKLYQISIKASSVLTKINFTKSDFKNKALFLDIQSTTPIDPRVLDKMLPFMTEKFGNPHSKSHKYGWETEKAVEVSREVNLFPLNKKFSKLQL